MASLGSLLQRPSLLRSSPSSSSSSSSAIICSLPSKIETVTRTPLYASSKRHRYGLCLNDGDASSKRHRYGLCLNDGDGGKQRSVVPRSTLDEVYLVDPPPVDEATAALKIKLLNIVSGLNRGLAASVDDLQKADAAAKELEDVGGLVDLSTDIDKLQGRWKLIYSSAFSGRTLGGSRPGPPTGRLLPITLGQVFQRIDIFSKDFDNIVELELGAPWPIPPVEVTATLAHKFELIGSAKIRIIFEKTTVKTKGNLSQLPPLEVPRIPDALRPPSNTGTGEFEVTYLDSNTRITRGDREELRVFVLA